MPKAQQKSAKPTRKVLAGWGTVIVVTAVTMLTSYEPSAEMIGAVTTGLMMVIQYLIPPSTQDQIQEVIEDVRDAQG